MRHCLILVACCWLLLPARSAGADTLRVRTHDRTYVTTDPAKGYKSYPAWGRFPGGQVSYRKVLLDVTLRCPEGLMCAEWDYLDFIYLRRKGGVGQPPADVELARMLTPYGRRFNADWSFSWQVDLSDFGPLLHDSLEVEYYHSGYERSDDRGWLVTLDFRLITGPPPMELVAMNKVYEGSFPYGEAGNPIEKYLPPVPFLPKEGVATARLRIQQTGHGMEEPDGCAEFCAKYREIWLDGVLLDRKKIWKECASNPLYPQAGTWIFDRANWCPGELHQPDSYDFPVGDGRVHTLDVNMEPYAAAKAGARYQICAWLFQYRPARLRNDAAVDAIIAPSTADPYKRENPFCGQPRIRIKNLGRDTLYSVMIEYGFAGIPTKRHPWKGVLPPQASAETALPALPLPAGTSASFSATLSQPNGQPDEYSDDNTLSTYFTLPPVYPPDLVFYLKTNLKPAETGYVLADATGHVWRQRNPGTLDSTRVYRDTFRLAPGCYTLSLVDTAGDGLEFWYFPEAGKGQARLHNRAGQLLKFLQPDFGNEAVVRFSVGTGKLSPPEPEPVIEVFPIRNKGKFSLDVFFNETQKQLSVTVKNDKGAVVAETAFRRVREDSLPMDLSALPDGIYQLHLSTGKQQYQRRVKIAR